MSGNDKIVFVTVGSTRFDALVTRILSEEVIEALKHEGFTNLVVQAGNSPVGLPSGFKGSKDPFNGSLHGLPLELWTYKPSLKEEYERASLVIGHAGSGTILEVLRLGRRMIAVPNETLLHNHQEELAEALDTQGYLISSTIASLPPPSRQQRRNRLNGFRNTTVRSFSTIIDREMGYI